MVPDVNAVNRPKQGILTMNIKDLRALYAAYMSFVRNGGLFIPTDRMYQLGDEIFVLLSLMDEPERLPIAGKVVWVTPKSLGCYGAPGVGIQFADEDAGVTRQKIETRLAGMVDANNLTYTM